MACIIDSWVPTASMTECAPSPSVRSLICGDALVAALVDDVGGAELAGELLPVGVAAHGDDPLGAELLGGEDAEQADRAVADDGDGLARAGLGGDGGEPAGAEHVGGGEQARDQVVGRACPGVATRVPSASGMRAYSAWVPMAPIELGVHAAGLVAGPADLAGVVGGEERADDELAGLDGRDVAADLLDDADVLVAHRRRARRRPRCRGRATGPSRRRRWRTAG